MVPASVCAYGSGIFTLISLKFKTPFYVILNEQSTVLNEKNNKLYNVSP